MYNTQINKQIHSTFYNLYCTEIEGKREFET